MINFNKQQEIINEEATKYFANGFECKKEDVYQTIVDNKLYDINLEKKEYLKTTATQNFWHSHRTQTKAETHKAAFHINTRKFIEKFDYKNEKFKILIDKMLHCLEMFFLASKNYTEYSLNQDLTITDFFRFLIENITNFKEPYNQIMYENQIILVSFSFNIISLYMTKLRLDENYTEQDNNLPFDLSPPGMTEYYNEDWDLNKKSKYIKGYLTAAQAHSQKVLTQWLSYQFVNDSYKDSLRIKFTELDKRISSSLNQLEAQDKLSGVDIRSSLFSFFDKFKSKKSAPSNHQEDKNDLPKNALNNR